MVLQADVPKDQSFVATADAAGVATITVIPTRDPWLVQQVSIEMPSAPVGAVCALRKRGQLITPMIAAGDVAAGEPPVTLYPGEPMTIVWTGATPGTQGQATVWYQLVRYA